MQDAILELDALVQGGKGKEIQSILNLCNPVDTESVTDVASLFEIYLNYIADYIDQFQ